MKRQLTALEREQLCDLFNKCGEGDLLDFIHGIKRQARHYGWTQQQLMEIMRHIPDDPAGNFEQRHQEQGDED